jgi:hypothetical protein
MRPRGTDRYRGSSAPFGHRRAFSAGAAGQSLVEAAVALPLVLMVAVALVQFALYAHAQHVVVAAVRDGARVASGDGRTTEEGLVHAQALLRAGLGGHARGVSLAAGEADGGTTVVVEARGRYRTAIPWVAEAGLPLYGRAVVRKERFRPGRMTP